jgi:hypothetical protein
MYYETISSFPVYIYSRFINRNVKILVHFHEYTSPSEYEAEMRLVRVFHKFEKYIFRISYCVSHTNKERLDFFLIDNKMIEFNKIFILPNYPPLNWSTVSNNNILPSSISKIKKIVYIGSIGIHDTYLLEFLNWVVQKQAEYSFDIYSFNIDSESRLILKNYDGRNVKLFAGVNYSDIPKILRGYDIGIIFYKAHSLNYEYNAPNKLFEYLACNLDVWFSRELFGCAPYQKLLKNRIFDVDFADQDFSNYDLKIEFEENRETLFFSEIVYSNYLDYINLLSD